MDVWGLPNTAIIGGVSYPINADFRDVLEIIAYLNDEAKPLLVRWQIALGLFFEGEIPHEHQQEATQFLTEFISYGVKEGKEGVKLIDWDQDARMIISEVKKVAGIDVRSETFYHWWSFLADFYGMGEGQLSTVISIRAKLAAAAPLTDWEKEYYEKNKKVILFAKEIEAQYDDLRKYLEAWLD